jgi:hypothetical protein
MPPVLAWTLGWTVFVVAAGVTGLVADAGFTGRGVVLLPAAGGIAGMAGGAFLASRGRAPGRDAAARRHAVAWAGAGTFAFVLFGVSFDMAAPTDAPDALPALFRPAIRMLAWFGGLGGFLAVVAAAGWQLPFRVFVSGLFAAVVWGGLLLGCGTAGLFGLSVGYGLTSDAMGPGGGMVVAGLVTGLVTGAFLGSLGEAVNRLTFRSAA